MVIGVKTLLIDNASANYFELGVRKVCIITIKEDQWKNSCKMKTLSCSDCNINFAHSQPVIIHEKDHDRANQFAVSVQKVSIITKFRQVKNIVMWQL